MAFPERFLDELTARTDLVDLVGRYVPLVKRGNRFFGRCPFHNEKTPSFNVLPERDMFYCFGCHAGGGAIQFVMKIENLGFVDAVHLLAKRAGMPVPESESVPGQIPRERLLELNRMAARWFYDMLQTPQGAGAAAYLGSRGVSAKVARRFGLGAAPPGRDSLASALLTAGATREELAQSGLIQKSDRGQILDAFRDRLMFPILDPGGKVIAFSGRSLGEALPKYKNSADSALYSKRRTLYGLHRAKSSQSDFFLLVEGNFDVIMLHQNGFDSALATCGTALTSEQAKLMARYKSQVVLCYDGDAAGLAATQKAIPVLDGAGLKVRCLPLPAKMDPDELIRQYGTAAFDDLLQGAQGHMEYRLALLSGQSDLTTDAGKVDYLRGAVRLLLTLSSEAERDVYAGHVAKAAGVTKNGVLGDLERALGQRRRKQEKELKLELTYPRDPLNKAEEQVLAHMLRRPELLDRARERLTVEDFADPRLQTVFTHILRGGLFNDPSLSPEQAGLIARLLASAEEASEQAFEDCVSLVLAQSAMRRAVREGEDELYLKYRLQKEKKSFGG